MTDRRPQFRLERVLDDGSRGVAAVVPVTAVPWDTRMPRRGALGIGVVASAAALLLKGRSAAAQTGTVPSTVLYAHRHQIKALGVTADGAHLVTGSDDESIKFWSLSNNAFATKVTTDGAVNEFALITSGGSNVVVVAAANSTKAWNVPGATLAQTLSAGMGASALAATSNTVALGYPDQRIELWGFQSNVQSGSVSGHKAAVTALAISPDGSLLVSGSADKTVKVWSLPALAPVATLEGHKDTVHCLAISPDGTKLATGSEDNTVMLWSLPDGQPLATLKGHTRGSSILALDGVRALAFSPDGTLLASGGWDQVVNLWSVSSRNLVNSFVGHQAGVAALAFTPDGGTLISGDALGVVILWNPLGGTGEQFRTFLFDPAANDSAGGVTYTVSYITYTLPCGSPIPAGAVCTCNCVAGSYVPPAPPSGGGGGGGGGGCICNRICTCVPVFTPSSHRWKTNVTALDDALERVTRLRGVRFEWTPQAPDDRTGADIGLIAEEVAQVVPEVVCVDDRNRPAGVDYARLAAILVEAVKSQQEQIVALQREVAALKATHRKDRESDPLT